MAKASADRNVTLKSGSNSYPEQVERLQGMCHHGFITEERAQEVIERIQNGHQTVDEAVEELKESCPCGLFLPSRARRILNGPASPSGR